MTAEILQQQIILWDGYNLTTRLKSVNLTQEIEALDNTTFGCTNRSNVPGLRKVAAQIEGIFDNTNYDQALNSTFASSNKLVSICRNSTEGALAWFFNATHANYEALKGNTGDLAGFSAGAMSRTYPLCRGTLLFNQASLASSSTGSGQQLGAISSTQTLYAGLHILAIDDNAGDTIDVTIQSDSSGAFSSPATQITFSQMTDIGSEFKTVPGAITDTWYRANYSISGDTPAFAAAVVMAIRNTPT